MSDTRDSEVAVGSRVGLFGSTSLQAREMRAILEGRALPVVDLKLYDDQGEGTIAEFDGEALLVARPDEELAAGLDVALLCGTRAQTLPYLDWPARRGFVAVDVSGASSGRPGVPLIHMDINPGEVAAKEGGRPAPLIASPHPVSHNVATVCHALARHGAIRRIDAFSLLPAADRGEPGIQELYDQTLGLLNFASVPKDTFGRQIAFNALPAQDVTEGGPDGIPGAAPRTEIAALLGMEPSAVMTSSVYVAIFHGHAHALTVTFERPVRREELHEGLAGDAAIRMVDDPDSFSPVDLAGQDTVAVNGLRADPLLPERVSLWIFCDNLKGGAALNAVRIMERVIELRREGSR